jgi:hypothetical protein
VKAIRANKFSAKKQEIDGIKFDSKKEACRYLVLKSMQDEGRIECLETQVEFKLIDKQKKPSGGWERAACYTADFRYRDGAGRIIVEDVKSAPTRKKPDYVLRRKLMLLVHGVEIVEL